MEKLHYAVRSNAGKFYVVEGAARKRFERCFNKYIFLYRFMAECDLGWTGIFVRVRKNKEGVMIYKNTRHIVAVEV
jgi:hypothetical protein